MNGRQDRSIRRFPSRAPNHGERPLTADQHLTRRLAAILAADVVGYTRLMGEDETGTLLHLNLVWAEIFNPTVARYRGRHFLIDGYHRAAGLLRAGITTVPCVFIEAQSFEQVVSMPGLFTYETVFADRPPRLVDFWDPEVSDDVVRPAVRKVIRVRGDEFVVEG